MAGNSGKITEIKIKPVWKKILEHNNEGDFKVIRTEKTKTGFRQSRSSDECIETTHKASSKANVGVKFPDAFQIKGLEISSSLEFLYSYDHKTNRRQMSTEEVYSEKEVTYSVTIPPETLLVRWQLTVDIAGNELDLDVFLDRDDDEAPPEASSILKIQEPRRIIIGQTKFYIKHKATGKFINVVARVNCPCATLSDSVYGKFTIYSSDRADTSIKIKTFSTMWPGYDILYSSDEGAIYFGVLENKNILGVLDVHTKQNWTMAYKGKSHLDLVDQLYDGVVVTFVNKRWPGCYMCYNPGMETDVYCLKNKSDAWVLVVAE